MIENLDNTTSTSNDDGLVDDETEEYVEHYFENETPQEIGEEEEEIKDFLETNTTGMIPTTEVEEPTKEEKEEDETTLSPTDAQPPPSAPPTSPPTSTSTNPQPTPPAVQDESQQQQQPNQDVPAMTEEDEVRKHNQNIVNPVFFPFVFSNSFPLPFCFFYT